MELPLHTITMNKGKLAASYSHTMPAANRPKITNSRDAYELLTPLFDGIIDYKERFILLLLNRANKVLGYVLVSEGGVTGTVVDPKIVFQHALMTNATGLVLCHNHPSGQLTPSAQDTEITAKLKQGAKMLDMQILDHIILTEESYYSFADNSLL